MTLSWHQDEYSDIIRAKSKSLIVGTVVQDRINDDPNPFIWLSSTDKTTGRAASLDQAKEQLERAWRASPLFDAHI